MKKELAPWNSEGKGVSWHSCSSPRAEDVMKKVALGRYIVVDPRVCHGKPTFRGTRIFVSSVLDQVASGMDWDAISAEWRGSISKGAIAEAVRLACDVFNERAEDLAKEAAGA